MFSTAFNVLVLLLCVSGSVAAGSVDGGRVVVTDGSLSAAVITGEVSHDGGNSDQVIFTDADLLSVRLRIQVDPADAGAERSLFLAMRYNGNPGRKTGRRGYWTRWSGYMPDLLPFASKRLAAEELLEIADGQQLAAGEYQFIGGYQTASGAIVYNASPLSFIVFAAEQSGLHRYNSASMLETYLKQALLSGGNPAPYPGFLDFSPLPVSPSGEVSTTNLQEAGVDEDDLIKTDGRHLYVLADCGATLTANDCVRVFSIQEDPPVAQPLAELPLKADFAASGLYLLAGREGIEPDLLVTVGGNSTWGPMPMPFVDWFAPWGWQATSTDVLFYDVSDPAAPRELDWLRIDGAMVSSRRIGDTLYLVSRYTPTLDGYILYPSSPEEEASNQQLLYDTGLEDLMPAIRLRSGQDFPVVGAGDCLLPPSAPDLLPDPTVITLLAIPLDRPQDYQSACITGPSETLYVSPESLYLATTRHSYEYTDDTSAPIIYQENHRTLLHKFALQAGGFEYRGSGEVDGHLGWDMDKKPFRMGEHEGVLRVATSLGSTWNFTSSTSLTLLEESAGRNALKETGRLDNLGKPGERLYAARFLGDRAYLVTFRNIDPLYVIDLSDPYAPFAAGELEIAGYSDYLHPVGQDLLLGIGKDAIVDEEEFAWYQGVKLSLFDVSDPFNPVQLDSMILGKRGTDSDLLHDHHALAYLPPVGTSDSARLAIPLKLHDTPPPGTDFDPADPTTFYDWTHTGLYVFDIATGASPTISNSGRVVVEQPPEMPQYFLNTDRSVLLGDSIHYVHGGEVYSSLVEPVARAVAKLGINGSGADSSASSDYANRR